jgi:hypothetical protein
MKAVKTTKKTTKKRRQKLLLTALFDSNFIAVSWFY